MTSLCPACLAPIPIEHNRVVAHREQIVTAYGWGDGYSMCSGSGRTPRHDFQPEARRRHMLSEEGIAELSGRRTYQSVWQWESGTHDPTLSSMRAWTAALGYDLVLVAREACASCDGARWVDDENWQPEDYERKRAPFRQPGSGRIPCGACNHGGWSEPDGQETS